MIRILPLALAIALAAPPAAAQDRSQTLADIRQDLTTLYVEIQRLRTELSTTGGATTTGGGRPLERLDAIESQVQRLTAKAEELEFRIETLVEDGTNRVGDLEFRLCELEPDCDIASLGETPRLGGGAAASPAATAAPVATAPAGPQFAVGEQGDFDRAKAALAAGNTREAAALFETYAQTYPGGAFIGEAHYNRGLALETLGDTAPAARAFLEAFSSEPEGPRAPEALYKLGVTLDRLGQSAEACVTLGEVANRFPGSPMVGEAATAMAQLNCG